jgi:hypothetical protein
MTLFFKGFIAVIIGVLHRRNGRKYLELIAVLGMKGEFFGVGLFGQ